MSYTVIRSNRNSLSIQIGRNGEIIVRVPLFVGNSQIEQYILQHLGWIEKQQKKQHEKNLAVSGIKPMTEEQFSRLKKLARKLAVERIAYYAPKVGVSGRVKRLSIRCQKTKWGSCTSNGSICINCLLALAPKEVFDSVIVHELCHLLEMNHSSRFYAHVQRVFPEYKKCYRWLKDNGAKLYAMVPPGK